MTRPPATTRADDAAPPEPAGTSDPRADGGLPPRWRQRLSSLRVRIFVWYILLLAFTLALTIFAVHTVMHSRLAERIDRDLNQEIAELHALADGRDPETGEPFNDQVERLLTVFLRRNLPARNEAMIAIVDGQVIGQTAQGQATTLLGREDVVAIGAELTQPERDRTTLPELGAVEYVAVPLRVRGETAAVFLVAILRAQEEAEVAEVVRTAVLVALLALGLAAVAIWTVAGRVLEPVRSVTRTARTISDTDLGQRIPSGGADEVSVLAATFNLMLDRLQLAFDSQRAFIDDAGHELRTPITIIRGHLELLDHSDAVDRRETLELVVDELDRMHRMVEDLLLLATAERPDFLVLEAVDVDRLTRTVLAKAEGLGDRLWTLDRVASARVVADRQRLTQALVQLCQNAVTHTRPGDAITVGSDVHGGDVRLWVADRGEGVEDADRDRIFERFSRGGGRARHRTPGAGLGLAIVRTIVEAHGGRIELRETPGGGATFTIVLPVDQPV